MSGRCATLVRKGVERVLALTLRQWLGISIVILVVIATAIHQYFEYCAILPEHKRVIEEMTALKKTCEIIKTNHYLAYLRMESDCEKAKVIIQFTPEWSAFSALVNSSWPHADNLVEWSIHTLGRIFSSLQAAAIFTALLIVFWPSVKQRSLGLVKDEINRHKEDKIEKELHKMAKARAALLTTFAQQNNQLRQAQCGGQRTGDS